MEKSNVLVEQLAYLASRATPANNPGGFDVNLAAGMVMVNGKEYQLVFSLMADKKNWLPQEAGVFYSSTSVANADGSIDEFIKAYMKNDH